MASLIHLMVAKKVRRNFGKGDKKRDAGLTSPEDIIRYDNISYTGQKNPSRWQLLDLYRPKKAEGKLPVIVSVHGGAWVYGDKDVYQFYCMKLAQRGFALVNFSYRLAPEYKFPASMEDTQKVFCWLAENAEKYSLDLNNVFAVGDSAGAHILSLYASARTNKDYCKNYPFIKEVTDNNLPLPKIKALAFNCGKYDMLPELNKDKAMKLMLKVLMPHGGTKEEIELINGAGHLTKDFPPAFVMTCYGDFLFNQAPVIIRALEAAGVEHEFHCYGKPEKPLWHVFHCDPKLQDAVICNDDECNFFKSRIE